MTAIDRHKIAAARLWAVSRFPYLASGVFACRIVAVDGLGGIAVDPGWRLYVDPEIVGALDVGELGSLLVHHTGHLLRDHAGRASALGIEREAADDWAMAADAEINDDLAGADLQMPGEVVLPSTLGCEDGRLAEEYFQAIRREPKPGCECPRCGSGADAQRRPWDVDGEPSVGHASARLLRCQVAADVLRHCRGREPGTVPAGLRRWAEELLHPKIDWRKVLAAEVRAGIAAVAGCVDYTYRRPSRRASAVRDVVLPALRRPVPEVAVVCDTSGSMSEHLLGMVLAEVEGLLRGVGLGPQRLRVLSVDAAVHTVRRVSRASQIELVGGGGTDMGRGIEAAMAMRPPPDVVVVLTDGYTPWPHTPPRGARVVVGLIGGHAHGHPAPAWARVVPIEDAA